MFALDVHGHTERIRRAVQQSAISPHQPDLVTQSWARCIQDYGLSPDSQRKPPVLTHAELLTQRDKNSLLINEARHEMNTLYQQLADPELAVVLVDTYGTVLHMVASSRLEDELSPMGLTSGAVWNEEQAGTNGMGTCLAVKEPIVIQQTDHFFAQHIQLTCSAAPISDHDGNIIGALDVTSRSPLLQQHSLVLIGITARMIENRLLDAVYDNAYVVHFHSRPESIYTVHGGKLMVDGDGRLLSANRSALFQLGLPDMQALRNHRFDEVFQSTLDALLRRSQQNSFHPVSIYRAGASNRFFSIAQFPLSITKVGRSNFSSGYSNVSAEHHTGPLAERYDAPELDAFTPHNLPFVIEHGDPALKEQFCLASRVFEKNVPILIHGETGSGKEVFARALHQASARRNGPFVVLDCSSVPEHLIELELFGADIDPINAGHNPKRIGKLRQAHGGTLFLDEASDIKCNVQARLLRILDEGKIWSLNSYIDTPIDFQLISTTHKDLNKLIAQGEFRQDLYYRLNGLEVSLPPLRERQDKLALMRAILRDEQMPGVQFCPRLEEALLSYHWPGNIRQLRHTLRSLAVLSKDQTLSLDQVPAALYEMLTSQPGQTEPQTAASPGYLLTGPASAAAEAHANPPHHTVGPDTATTAGVGTTHQAASTLADAPAHSAPEHAVPEGLNPLEIAERRTLIQLLEHHRWNISAAAKSLDISRNTLYRKLHRLSIPLASQAKSG